jgi:16S rRNA A1518/A1519 N6-dimethyltransferase RsmA/KsgA/DIM1 with predicted DNA glycosylase/AP lyase activity
MDNLINTSEKTFLNENTFINTSENNFINENNLINENTFINNSKYNNIDEINLAKICATLITSEDNVIDIGSSLGDFAYNIAKKCKHVATFEENKDFFEMISKEIISHDIHNIDVYNVCLLDKNLDSYNFNNVKLLKISSDINMHHILSGAEKTIKNNNPQIIIHKSVDEKSLDILLHWGYKINNHEDCYHGHYLFLISQ